MRRTGLCLAIVGSIGLAACGGGGGDGDDSSGGGGSQASFDLLQTDFDALLSDYDAATPTPLVDMPVTGNAVYDGTALYSNVDTDPNVIIADPSSASRVRITADFAAAEVGGRLYDFRSADRSVTIAGDLALVNGVIQNNTIAADILGSLEVDGRERDHTGGRLLGSFLGPDANAVGGPILEGGSPTKYNGVFVAER
jgi:hypothetical protein